MKGKVTTLKLLFIFLILKNSTSREICVDACLGEDIDGCGGNNSCCQSLKFAVNQAVDSDVIFLYEGLYTGGDNFEITISVPNLIITSDSTQNTKFSYRDDTPNTFLYIRADNFTIANFGVVNSTFLGPIFDIQGINTKFFNYSISNMQVGDSLFFLRGSSVEIIFSNGTVENCNLIGVLTLTSLLLKVSAPMNVNITVEKTDFFGNSIGTINSVTGNLALVISFVSIYGTDSYSSLGTVSECRFINNTATIYSNVQYFGPVLYGVTMNVVDCYFYNTTKIEQPINPYYPMNAALISATTLTIERCYITSTVVLGYTNTVALLSALSSMVVKETIFDDSILYYSTLVGSIASYSNITMIDCVIKNIVFSYTSPLSAISNLALTSLNVYNLTISDCRFSHLSNALDIFGSIQNSAFINNHCAGNFILLRQGSVQDSTFNNITAKTVLELKTDQRTLLQNNLFENNKATSVMIDSIYQYCNPVSIMQCVFKNNDPGYLTPAIGALQGSAVIEECIFENNIGPGYNGVAIISAPVVNCRMNSTGQTITSNSSSLILSNTNTYSSNIPIAAGGIVSNVCNTTSLVNAGEFFNISITPFDYCEQITSLSMEDSLFFSVEFRSTITPAILKTTCACTTTIVYPIVMSCASGYIYITQAQYGQPTIFDCGNCDFQYWCSKNYTAAAAGYCNNRQSCTLDSSFFAWADPCIGFSKSASTNFLCIETPVINYVHSSKCVYQTNFSFTYLECEKGLITVNEALYGLIEKEDENCSFSPSGCFNNITSMVAVLCNNRIACEINSLMHATVSFTWCSGSDNYLGISYQCISDSFYSNSTTLGSSDYVVSESFEKTNSYDFNVLFNSNTSSIQCEGSLIVIPSPPFPSHTQCSGNGFYGGAYITLAGVSMRFSISLWDFYDNYIPYDRETLTCEVTNEEIGVIIPCNVIFDTSLKNYTASYYVEYENRGSLLVSVYINGEIAVSNVVLVSESLILYLSPTSSTICTEYYNEENPCALSSLSQFLSNESENVQVVLQIGSAAYTTSSTISLKAPITLIADSTGERVKFDCKSNNFPFFTVTSDINYPSTVGFWSMDFINCAYTIISTDEYSDLSLYNVFVSNSTLQTCLIDAQSKLLFNSSSISGINSSSPLLCMRGLYSLISNCSFQLNSVSSVIQSDGELLIASSEFSHNFAADRMVVCDGILVVHTSFFKFNVGGVIDSHNAIFIDGCDFNNNEIQSNIAIGAVVTATSNERIDVSNSQFNSNRVTSFQGISYGGVLSLTSSSNSIQLTNVTFTNNSATIDTNGTNALASVSSKLQGGAIWINGYNISLNIWECLFSENLVFVNELVSSDVSGYGGAIYISSEISILPGTITMNNTQFHQNVASGGSLQPPGTGFAGNSFGAALFISSASPWNISIENSNFSNNNAIAGNGDPKLNQSSFINHFRAPGNSFGGAVCIEAPYSSILFLNVLFENNTAHSNISVTNEYSNAEGGSILVISSAVTVINQCTFNNNNVIGNTAKGGAVSSLFDLQIFNSTFSNNQLKSSVSSSGGALYITGAVSIQNVTFESNKATSESMSAGGAVYHEILFSNLNYSSSRYSSIVNTTFISNNAINAGGLFIKNSGGVLEYNQQDVEFFNNQATNGGALYIEFGDPHPYTHIYSFDSYESSFCGENTTFQNIIFIENTAYYGGAFYSTQSLLLVECSSLITFQNNSAFIAGGAIYYNQHIDSSELTNTQKITFINNTAPQGDDLATTIVEFSFPYKALPPSIVYPGQPFVIILALLDSFGNVVNVTDAGVTISQSDSSFISNQKSRVYSTDGYYVYPNALFYAFPNTNQSVIFAVIVNSITYTAIMQVEVVPCPPGLYLDGNICKDCPLATYVFDYRDSCLSCPSASFSEDSLTNCVTLGFNYTFLNTTVIKNDAAWLLSSKRSALIVEEGYWPIPNFESPSDLQACPFNSCLSSLCLSNFNSENAQWNLNCSLVYDGEKAIEVDDEGCEQANGVCGHCKTGFTGRVCSRCVYNDGFDCYYPSGNQCVKYNSNTIWFVLAVGGFMMITFLVVNASPRSATEYSGIYKSLIFYIQTMSLLNGNLLLQEVTLSAMNLMSNAFGAINVAIAGGNLNVTTKYTINGMGIPSCWMPIIYSPLFQMMWNLLSPLLVLLPIALLWQWILFYVIKFIQLRKTRSSASKSLLSSSDSDSQSSLLSDSESLINFDEDESNRFGITTNIQDSLDDTSIESFQVEVPKKKRSSWRQYMTIRAINFFLFFLLAYYTEWCKTIFYVFHLEKEEVTGKYYVISLPWLEASYDTIWFPMAIVAFIFFLLYILGIPLLFCLILKLKRRSIIGYEQITDKRVPQRDIDQVIGFVYGDYKERVYYWEIFSFLRKLLLVFFIVVLPVSSIYQPFTIGLILYISVILQVIFQPFRYHTENILEFVGILTILLCYTIKGSVTSNVHSTSEEIVLITLFACAVLVAGVYFFFMVIAYNKQYRAVEKVKLVLSNTRKRKYMFALLGFLFLALLLAAICLLILLLYSF